MEEGEGPTDPPRSGRASRRSRAGPPLHRNAWDEDHEEESLAAYAKKVVDGLPPLTGEQRDRLALIFRSSPPRKPSSLARQCPRKPAGALSSLDALSGGLLRVERAPSEVRG
jgi:hypothetical protein